MDYISISLCRARSQGRIVNLIVTDLEFNRIYYCLLHLILKGNDVYDLKILEIHKNYIYLLI